MFYIKWQLGQKWLYTPEDARDFATCMYCAFREVSKDVSKFNESNLTVLFRFFPKQYTTNN